MLYRFSAFSLDTRARRLTCGDDAVELSPRLFDLLTYFVRHAGTPLSKRDLAKGVWVDSYATDATVTQTVMLLRQALAPQQGEELIATLPRRGYQFVAAVTEHSPTTRVRERLFAARQWLAVAVTAASALILAFQWFKPDGAPDDLALDVTQPTFTIVDFESQTPDGEDDWLGAGLKELLTGVLRGAQVQVVPAPENPTAPASDYVVRGRYAVTEGSGLELRVDLYAPHVDAPLLSLREDAHDGRIDSALTGVARRILDWTGRDYPTGDQLALPSVSGPGVLAVYALAIDAERKDHDGKAEKALREALEQWPEAHLLRTRLISVLIKQGRWREAHDESGRLDPAALQRLPGHFRMEAEALTARAERDWDTAAEKFRALVAQYPHHPDYLNAYAMTLRDAGRLAEAVEFLVAEIDGLESAQERARLELRLLEFLIRTRDFEAAQARCDDLLQWSRDAADVIVEANALRICGARLLFEHRFDEANELLEVAIARHRQLGDDLGVAKDQTALAAVATQQGDYARAIEIYESAIASMESSGSLDTLVVAVVSRAILHQRQGDSERARDGFLSALDILAQSGDQTRMGPTFNGLAIAYRALGEHHKALASALKAVDHLEASGELLRMGNALMTVGDLTYQLGLFDDAQRTASQQLMIASDEHMRRHRGHARLTLGMTAAARGQIQTGVDELARALEDLYGTSDPTSTEVAANAERELIDLLLLQGNIAAARQRCDALTDAAHDRIRLTAMECAGAIAAFVGQPDAAQRHLEAAWQLAVDAIPQARSRVALRAALLIHDEAISTWLSRIDAADLTPDLKPIARLITSFHCADGEMAEAIDAVRSAAHLLYAHRLAPMIHAGLVRNGEATQAAAFVAETLATAQRWNTPAVAWSLAHVAPPAEQERLLAAAEQADFAGLRLPERPAPACAGAAAEVAAAPVNITPR